MIDNDQGRVSVWEYINPVALATFAYTSPLGSRVFGTYKAMAKGRGMILPGMIPLGDPVSLSAVSEAYRAGKATQMASVTGKSMLFGIEGFGAAKGIADGSRLPSQQIIRVTNSMLSNPLNPLAKYRSHTFRVAYDMLKVAKAEGVSIARGSTMHAGARMVMARPSAMVLGRAGIMAAGRVINPIMNILLAAQVTKFLAESAFKGIQATANAIDRATERVYNLELGGELSRGFLTGQAATERQRALQAIQSSHLSGRRFLGNEAQLVHS